MKRTIILLLFSCALWGQTNDYFISDTSKVRMFKNFPDTTDISYYLRIPDEEMENKRFRIYYDYGRLYSEFNCDSKGLIDTSREWYIDGTLKKVYYSKKNGNHALWEGTEFYKNKKLKQSRSCSNDTCITLMYYDNGKLEGKLYEKEFILFYLEKYYKNGQKMCEPNSYYSTKRKTHEVLYYESGKISQDRFFLSGYLVDEYKEYYENGTLKINGQYEPEAQYLSGNKLLFPLSRGSFKIGKWSYYSSSGDLEKEEFYEKDVITKTIKY